jgi:hypothetical protein
MIGGAGGIALIGLGLTVATTRHCPLPDQSAAAEPHGPAV